MMETEAAPPDGGGGRGPGESRDRREIKLTNINNVRKVTITSLDQRCKLSDLSIITLSRFIGHALQISNAPDNRTGRNKNNRGVLTPPDIVPKINFDVNKRTGKVYLTTTNSEQTKMILATKKLGDIDVQVDIPVGPNTVKGVAFARGLNQTSEEELIEELSNQGVVDVYHFRRRVEGGTFVKTSKVKLTFQAPVLPSRLRSHCG